MILCPDESKEGHTMRGEVQTGRPEVAGDRGARSVQERARLQIGKSRARGGAHEEHGAHGCDAGRVEAQRLVERPRELPRVERRARDAGRGADRQARGGGRPRCTQRAGEGSTADWEQGTGRRAHEEHAVHVCDAGGIPAGDVRVEVIQVREEPAHVSDSRDIPVGDGSVRCNGDSRVRVVGLDRRLQGDRTREGVGRRRRRGRWRRRAGRRRRRRRRWRRRRRAVWRRGRAGRRRR
eukprot:scaffold6041_cov54-Phaeocystis_antarctica.AAC.3